MEIKIKNLQKKIPIPQRAILKALKSARRKLPCRLDNLSIVFVGPQRMCRVNKKYLKHKDVTDVLSFDLGGGLGEIIVCPKVAKAQAVMYNTSTRREIILYVIHGFLHLCGFDDGTENDRGRMRDMEDKLLGSC